MYPLRYIYALALSQVCYSVLVSAGSPRIRIAFDLLVKDPRMIEQRNAVQLHLKMKEVKDKIERTENLKKQLFDERGKYVCAADVFN